MMNLLGIRQGEWGSPINKQKMLQDAILSKLMPQSPASINPQMGPINTAKVKGPSIWDKVGNNLAGLSGDAEGLLSDDDMKSARTQGLLSMGASLLADSGPKLASEYVSPMASIGKAIQAGQGAGQQAMGNKMNVMQMQSAKAGLEGQQLELEQAKKLDASRKAVVAKYPMPPQSDPMAMAKWIDQVLPHFIEMSDEETVARLSEIRKSLQSNVAKKSPQEIRVGNEVILRDPDTGAEVARYPIKPSPKDPNAPDHAAEANKQRMFTREQQLGDDFNKDTKTQREMAVKLRGAIGERDAAMAGDGAAQINILYAFVNSMDPASAVREGEIGLAKAAAPIWSLAQAQFDKYLNNESVTIPPDLVKRMTALMERRVTSWSHYIDERADYYGERGQRWGLDTTGLFPGLPRADKSLFPPKGK
jgi:hypothetical protein